MDHLDPDTLAAYVDGRLAVTELVVADRHIDGCDTCRHELSALAAMRTQPGSAARGTAGSDDKLGRYDVLRELGRGAMGVVLRAYDPELARPVAIKLLHEVADETRLRLRLEAQAMARLRHPHVVTVYDVVTDGDTMFVAMELVDGDTLRGHCRGKPWREVLEACLRAGEGLAAAHDARLVHRDFKPENVLCGKDGAVRVSDFGLARVDEVPADGATLLASTIAGTPAYMAPEIFAGAPASAQSDQFSFCVTTYEMLYGARPFAGTDVRTLRATVAAGRPSAPVATSEVPAWIWRVLERGLAREPEARFPSMHALLAALADDPAVRRRRRGLYAAGAALAVAAGAGAVWATRSDRPSCAIDPQALASAWDPAAAGRVSAAFAKVATPAAGARVVAALDSYGHAWLDARHAACEATYVRGDQSQPAFDRRIACLDRGRRQLGELVHLLADADADVTEHAVDAIAGLPDPASCTGTDEAEPLPAATADLDRATALESAGKTDAADALAAQVLAAGGTAIDPRVAAEALVIRARVAVARSQLEHAEALLFLALRAAERGHDDRMVAATWVEIVLTTGAQQHRFELATSNVRAADAALARIDPSPELVLRYDYAVGTMLVAQGKLPEARERLTAGLALTADAMRRQGVAGQLHAALCTLEVQAGKLADAKVHCERGLALLEQTFGPDHGRVAIALNSVGALAMAQHDLAGAQRAFERAIALFEQLHQTDQIGYALALSNLGTVFSRRDDLDHAQVQYERARDAFAAHHPDHPQRVLPLQGLGNIALERNDLVVAIKNLDAARAAIAATYAADSPQLSIAEYNLALAYHRNHQLTEAQTLADSILARSLATGHEQWMLAARALDLSAMLAGDRHDLTGALALRERGLAALDHANLPDERAFLLRQLGELHREMHHVDQSIAPLEEALRYFEAHPDNAYDVGATRWILARSLWETGTDRKRALELAHAAQDDLAHAASGLNLARLRAEISVWLRAHEKK